MTVSQKIFEIMRENHITQAQLSKGTGISPSTISDWKKKNTSPSSDKISVIADFLGIPVADLLGAEAGDVVSSGSNNNIQNGNNNNIEITACDYDINEKKLIEKFRELDYDEQIQLMAEVIERVKGKETE